MQEIRLTKGAVTYVDDDVAATFEGWNVYLWSREGRDTRYAMVHIVSRDGKHLNVPLHRLILGVADGVLVDHWDGDGLNNQRKNLRIATRQGNRANSCKNSGRKLPKGVQRTKWGTYQVQIRSNKILHHVGSFATEEEAAVAYREASEKMFGVFAGHFREQLTSKEN